MCPTPSLHAPYGRYRHAVARDAVSRWLFLAGQLPVDAADTVPEGITAQTGLVLANIEALLIEHGLARADLVRLTTYLIDPADRAGYMTVRDAWVADPPPASTLVYVVGLAHPACRVEIEAIAAA